MAEILGILSFAIGTPGVVIAFAQCGEYVKTLVRNFSNASELVRNIGAFGHDLHQGKLKLDLEIAEWVFSDENFDAVIKDALEDSLHQLQIALVEAVITLRSFFDKNGVVRRTYFTLFGERKASRVLAGLRRWQGDFDGIIDLIDKKRRLVPDDLLLKSSKLKVTHKADGKDYIPIAASSLFMADCEYADRGIHEIKILIEQKLAPADTDLEELRVIASILASRLNSDKPTRGVLQCLGYRQVEHFELIFRLPANMSRIQTLRSVISAPNSESYGGYPLQERFKLCHELCEAVLSVHSSNLVHKNIRPGTIVLVERAVTSSMQSSANNIQLGSPFLTGWFMLRKITELSSRRGAHEWMEDIYRHPRRQGRQPEERYNMGHDIYSLGVVLLEIALWETFVQPDRSPPISERYQMAAVRLRHVQPSESESLAKLTMPLVTQKVMVGMAETEVAQRMGSSLASFISTCLTCLDNGMNGLKESDFKNDTTTVAIRFREMFVQAFSNTPY